MKGKVKEEYIAFPKARFVYKFNPGISDEEAGRTIKAIAGAIVERRRGVEPLADAALENEDSWYLQKVLAARARWEKQHPGEPYPYDDGEPDDGEDAPHGKSDAPHGKSDALTNIHTNELTNIPTNEHTNELTNKPKERGVGGGHDPGQVGEAVSGSRKELEDMIAARGVKRPDGAWEK